MNLSYSEMIKLPSFVDRFEYLVLSGSVGHSTFGYSRYLNQAFYTSKEWKYTRRRVIIRDNGWDLAVEGYDIYNRLYVHHINPITLQDIEERNPMIFDMDNLVCCSFNTHQAIHFGDLTMIAQDPIERHPNDTCPWKV